MNVLSLFSGIGGLDLGLERAGMTICGQVEIDPWCRKVLARHWPEVPRHDDVRTAAEWWLGLVADTKGNRRRARRAGRPAGGSADGQGHAPAGLASAATGGRPAADLVAGGFPCQPVSLAGKGLAQEDSRWLWPAFAQVIRHLRPRFVLVENVPGLLVRGMGDVLGDLAALGYDAEWDSVPAAFVGAPHIRNRVWIIAYPHTASSRRGNPGRHDGLGPAGLDSDVADAERDGLEGTEHALAWQGTAAIGRRLADPDSANMAYANSGRLAEQPERDRWTQPQIFASPLRHDTLRRHPHTADTDREPLGRTPEPRSERSHWLTEPGVGRVVHGIPRRVDRLRGLGNAVVPQVAEHIGRLILEVAA